MTDTLRIKRRAAGGAAGPPSAMVNAEIAYNEQDNTLWYGYGGTASAAASFVTIGGSGAFLPLAGGTLTGALRVNNQTTLQGVTATRTIAPLLLINGDSNAGAGNAVQMQFGYNYTNTYQHWVTSRHNSTGGRTNAIDFYLNNGTNSGVYPTNALWGGSFTALGLSLPVGSAANPSLNFGNNTGVGDATTGIYDASNTIGFAVSGVNVMTVAPGLLSLANSGISLGSALDTGPDDAAQHLYLYGTTYGIGVTSGRINYYGAAGASHFFRIGGSDVLQVGPGAVTVSGTLSVSGTAAFSPSTTGPAAINFGSNMNAVNPAAGFGGYIGFNFTAGNTEVDFFNAYTGGGYSGFNFYQWNGTAYIRLAGLDKSGNLTVAGTVTGTGGAYLPLTGGTLSGALNINQNTAAIPALGAFSPGLSVQGADTALPTLALTSYGQRSAVFMRRADGTSASMTGLVNADLIGAIYGGGWDTTVWSGQQIGLTLNAGGTWSATSRPTYLGFMTTPSGSTTLYEMARMYPTGNFVLSPGTGAMPADDGINALQISGGGITVSSTQTATVGQIYLHPPSGTLAQISELRFGGTFTTGADAGNRYIVSLRSGFSSGAWGNEYLDVYVNNAVNDAASDANQAQIARFANAGVTLYRGLSVYNSAVMNTLLTVNAGMTFGSQTGANAQDLSKHIALWGTTYGFSITGGTTNYNGGAHNFYSGTVQLFSINTPTITSYMPIVLPADPSAPLQAATKQYVDNTDAAQLGTATPLIDSTAAVGTSTLLARQDHVHPTNLGMPSINCAGGVNVNLTVAQCNSYALYLYGALTANIQVIFPVATTAVRIWQVMNVTSGAFTITLAGTSGGTVALRQGGRQEVWTDGAGIYPANTDTITPGISDNTTTVPTTSWTRNTFLPLVGGTLSGGINFGSVTDSAPDNAALHLYLFGNSYGIGITGSRQNYFVPSGAGHYFRVGGADVLQVTTGAVNVTGTLAVSGATTLSGVLNMNAAFYLGNNSARQVMYVNGSTGSNRVFQWQTAGVARWNLGANATTETGGGSNSGADFDLVNFDDTGAQLLSPAVLRITRSSGLATFYGPLAANSTLAVTGASTFTGVVTANSNVNVAGALTLTGTPGIAFGSIYDSGPDSLTSHVALYGTTYGFGVTANRLNYVVPAGAGHYFRVNAADVLSVTNAGIAVTGTATVTGSGQFGGSFYVGVTAVGNATYGISNIAGQDGASLAINNVAVNSWNGIGFTTTVGSQSVPVGLYGLWMSTRTAGMAMLGALSSYNSALNSYNQIGLIGFRRSAAQDAMMFIDVNTNYPSAVAIAAGGTGVVVNARFYDGYNNTYTATNVGVATATVSAGGSAYVVNDVLTVSGGTGTAATLTVTAVSTGAITTVSVTTAGSYTALPASPAAVTGGTGTGATFTFTWLAAVLRMDLASARQGAAPPANPVALTAAPTFAATGVTANLTWTNPNRLLIGANSAGQSLVLTGTAGITMSNSTAFNSGATFGSTHDSSNTSMALHVLLHSSGYGFGTTPNRLNYNAPNAAGHYFIVNGVDVMSVTAGAITALQPVTLPANPTVASQAANKAYVDLSAAAAGVTISDTAPASPAGGRLWWDSVGLQLYVWYNDPNSSAWVIANNTSAGFVSVMNYGAKGDGTTDDTTAINNALSSSALFVYFPQGNYRVTGILTLPNNTKMWGAGYGSNIVTASATSDVVQVAGQNTEVVALQFSSSVTRTAGSFVNLLAGATPCTVRECYFYGGFTNVTIGTTGGPSYILNCFFWNTVATGTVIRITQGFNIRIRGCFHNTGTPCTYGIYITGNVGDVVIADSDFIHSGTCLAVTASTGQEIDSVWVHDTFFDTSTNGIGLNATGGTINRSIFTDVWTSSHTNIGFLMQTSAGGAINGVEIKSHHAFANTGAGLLINDNGVQNVRVMGSDYAGNNPGITIGANAKGGVMILGCNCSAYSGFGGNTYGIFLNNGADNFWIKDCNLAGNTTSAISVGTLPGAAGASYWIAGCLGFNSLGTGSFTLPANTTSIVQNHGLGLTPALVNIRAWSLGAQGAATQFWITNPTATQFTFNVNAAAAGATSWAWEARMNGM